jgi:hypothetical protein
MSGYFARLAAQVNGASVPGGRRPAQEPASLEQHVEVEAPPGLPLQEPMEGVAASPRLQRTPAVAEGAPPGREPRQPEPPAAAAADAARALTAPGKDMPAHETPSMPPGSADAVESTGTAFTPATPLDPPAHRMAPSAMATEAAQAVDAGPRTAAASRLAAGLAGSLPGQAAGKAAERAGPARPYAGFSASTARPGMAGDVPARPSRPSTVPANETAAAPRNDVRIGTITLEVRPPAAPAPAAPQALPAPAPVPQQVALRRHYLRWS